MFDDGVVGEAWPGVGVRKTTLKDWRNVKAYRLKATPTSEQIYDVRSYCDGYAADNPGYDYLGVISFIMGLKQRHKKWSNRFFCSEFVFAALNFGGIPLFERSQPWEFSPAMLEKSPLLVPDRVWTISVRQ